MAGIGPNILVVAGDDRERARIAAPISEAGFAVIAAAEPCGALEALRRQRFAAAVLAPQTDEGDDWLHQVRHRQPGIPAVLVLSSAALHLIDEEEDATIVKRPFDPRQLLGCVFELVLRDGGSVGADVGAGVSGSGSGSGNGRHSRAAELGIAAAQLACLHYRRTAAAAAGRGWLAQDLTRQIGRARSAVRGLAALGSAAVD
jgi:DNA-binding response OmpR family regulator